MESSTEQHKFIVGTPPTKTTINEQIDAEANIELTWIKLIRKHGRQSDLVN